MNIGGFSDAVFSVVAAFLADDAGRFVAEVEKVGTADENAAVHCPPTAMRIE